MVEKEHRTVHDSTIKSSTGHTSPSRTTTRRARATRHTTDTGAERYGHDFAKLLGTFSAEESRHSCLCRGVPLGRGNARQTHPSCFVTNPAGNHPMG